VRIHTCRWWFYFDTQTIGYAVNYYPFHLGDYAAHTGHLEPMEDLAYRRLLDVYYMREGALPADIQQTAKLVRMRSCAADVESVLNEFFVQTDDGWRHKRCDEEIAKMKDKQEKARLSGIASANARRVSAERIQQAKPTDVEEKSTDVERALGKNSTDVQLPTPTPTPTPIPNINNTGASARRGKPAVVEVSDVDQATWKDFQTLRKEKHAPVTQTAIDGIRREAEKAGLTLDEAIRVCCTRGWTAFRAKWVQDDGRLVPGSHKEEIGVFL